MYNKLMSKKKLPRSENIFFDRHKLLLLFLFIYIVLSFFLFDPKLFIGGDNAVYIILAESIVSGEGYKDMYMPDEPPHSQYPFGFPIMLSVPILIFGTNIILLKLLLLLTGLGSVYFMYKIGEYLFKEKVNIMMPFYLSIPILITYNHRILSEMPFLCFSLGALYFFIKAQENKDFFYYISFIFATYSFFIRVTGISLIISMMLFLLLKKQYRYFCIYLLIFLVVFIPWQIRYANISSEVGYIDQFLAKHPYSMELGRVGFFDLIIRVWENFTYYFFTALPMTLLPVSGFLKSKVLLATIGIIFTLFIIAGFLRKIKGFSFIRVYFLLNVIVLFIWPRIWSSERFLLPILPIYIIYMFYGIFWLGRRIKLRYFIPVVVGIFVFLNLLDIVSQARGTFTNNIAYVKGDKYAGYTNVWRHYFEIIDWIKENIPKGKVIMARKPELVYLIAGHKSFKYPFTYDHNKVKDAINRSDYIIYDNVYKRGTAQLWLLPILGQEPRKYLGVYKTKKPEFLLLKVIK